MFEEQIAKRFIGHTKELEVFEQWLTHPDGSWILFFHDAAKVPAKKGGVGKTWLLRKCANIAKERDKNIAVAVVDFFSVGDRDGVEVAQRIVKSLMEVHPEWSPEFFTNALAEYHEGISTKRDLNDLRDKLRTALTNDLEILDKRLVGENRQLLVFFDTYEVIEAYPTGAVLSPAYTFPDQYQFKRMGVVIAGRNAPDWEHPNWKEHRKEDVQCVPINPFTQEETVQFINDNIDIMGSLEVQSTQAQALYARTEGRPILVGLMADMLNNRVMTLNQLLEIPKNRFESYLVEQINNLEKPINWVILFMAHVYHRFNEALLNWLFDHSLGIKELMQDVQTHELSKKLLELSFVRRSGSGDNMALHDEMRRLVNKYNWTIQEQQTRLYRRELSLGAISYYLDQIDHESSEQMRQTYQVEMLYHKLYVDANEGFRFFEQHINRAIDLWQSAFARSLLQEAQQFTNDLSPDQYYSMILAEAALLSREEDNKAALKLYEKLEQEANESWLLSHHADILFHKGTSYQDMDQLDEAVDSFSRSMELETKRDNESRVATILSSLGVIARRTGNLDQAEHYYEQGIVILKKLGDLRGYANILNSLGGLYRLQGKTEEALRRCKVAWRIRKDLYEQGELSEVAVGMSLGTIGVIYLRVDDLVNAEKFFQNAFKIFERNNFKSGIAAMYNRFGQIALARNELARAMEWFQQGYKASEGVDAEAEINSLNKQGWVHVLQGQLQESIPLLEKAIERAREVNDYYQEAELLIDLADVFERLERLKQSSKYLHEAVDIARRYKYYYLLGIAEDFRGDNRYKDAEYQSAFRHFGEYCHYMALYNPVQYEKAVRKVTDQLLNVPKEEISTILDELVTQWLSFKLDEKSSDLLNALGEIRMLIDL